MSSTKLNTSKRNAVRLALVTGSTLAAIIGAQNLAALGSAPSAISQAALPSDAAFQSQPSTSQQQSARLSGEEDDDHEGRTPSISVLRPSGQPSASSTQQSATRRPVTRSSR